MKVDLDTLRAFFASAPFMVDLGVQPVAVGEGTVDGDRRTLVVKASATMAVTPMNR